MNLKVILKKIINKIKIIPLYFLQNNDRKYIEYQYKLLMGEKPNLDNPTTFNEKINYLKLNYYDPLLEQCCDKVEVRKYVKDKGLENILTKLYAVYNSIDEINLDELPEKFVIKTTHASGGVYVVKDKNKINVKEMKKVLRKSTKLNLYKLNKEWQYKNVKPRIMVEELIETDKQNLIDYKIHCFNGIPRIVQVSVGIKETNYNHCMDFYDMNFKLMDIKRTEHKIYGKVEKPDKWQEMIDISKILSKDFENVRVDLYCENSKIYFGELTFTSSAGYGKFETKEMDEYIGKFWYMELEK